MTLLLTELTLLKIQEESKLLVMTRSSAIKSLKWIEVISLS